MPPKVLYCTCGLPRSGKSTWAQKTGYPIVNPDSIRLALHGEAFLPKAEKMVWTIAEYMVRSLFLAGHGAVVLDATNLTQERRLAWVSPSWDTVFVLFNTPIEVCIKRAEDGGRDDLVPVISRMNASMDLFPVADSIGEKYVEPTVDGGVVCR